MNDDQVLDGNGMDGLLMEVLAADPSTLERTCQGCGDQFAIGAHRAYRGAGVVLRCPGCDAIGLVVGVLDDRWTVQANGTFMIARRA